LKPLRSSEVGPDVGPSVAVPGTHVVARTISLCTQEVVQVLVELLVPGGLHVRERLLRIASHGTETGTWNRNGDGNRNGDVARVRRGKVLIFSGCNSHPATGSLQPVAIGAAVEATKPSEPSRQMCRFGDAASRQAVT